MTTAIGVTCPEYGQKLTLRKKLVKTDMKYKIFVEEGQVGVNLFNCFPVSSS
jgi:hypothetical protein